MIKLKMVGALSSDLEGALCSGQVGALSSDLEGAVWLKFPLLENRDYVIKNNLFVSLVNNTIALSQEKK